MVALVVGWRFKEQSVSWPHSRNLIALVSGEWTFGFFALALLLFQLVVHRVFVLNALTLFIHLCPNRLRLSQRFFPLLFFPSFYCLQELWIPKLQFPSNSVSPKIHVGDEQESKFPWACLKWICRGANHSWTHGKNYTTWSESKSRTIGTNSTVETGGTISKERCQYWTLYSEHYTTTFESERFANNTK